MKILSIDVGIKTLSYVIIDYNTKMKILDWKLVDLTSDNNEIIIKRCKCNNVTKKIMYEDVIYDDKCGRHTQFKKELLNNTAKIIINKQKAKTFSKQMLGESLCKKFDENKLMIDIDYVIIENQPQKNNLTKSLFYMIYQYFVIRGIVDNKRVKKIIPISPCNKLTVYNGPEIETKKIKYARTKYLAIEYTKYFLKNSKKYLDYFINNKKKDDLADCFLQCIWFIKNKL